MWGFHRWSEVLHNRLGGLFEFGFGGFLEGGEFRVAAQPCVPLLCERAADTLAAQDCVQMSA